MRAKILLWTWGLAGALTLALTGPARSDDAPAKPVDKEPPDPPGTGVYMAQFRALFDAWDLNKDGYLDKEELAKAFRGPKAKPFDYVPPPKAGSDSDKDPPAKDAPAKDAPAKDAPAKDAPAKDAPAKDAPAKDASTDTSRSPGDPKDPKKPDYSQFPDYNFLVQLDQDNDQMISRHEFLSWARDYSVQLKQQADAAARLLQLEQKLAGAKVGSKEYKALQKQLTNEEKAQKKAMDQLAKQARAFDKQLQQALTKVKR
jgi:hypothetical protein